ncbi:purple acid phosphatase 18 isoform X2 [Physcomitrium patens]|nr:purple acid phosphatase 18-like isoform X2 [Physcomitrium patens]|eukprot:XP_024361946.1 purple acid phosphatase 18-like isoform X2 [Physcomitrella patens]
MKVSWMTADKNVPSTVQYGIQSGKLLQTASGVSTSYRFITYQSGQMHHVKIGPLQDSTTYFYRCGGYGPEYNFTTPPPSGPSEPVKFAVVGDLGQTDWTMSTLGHVAAYDYDVLLFAGDLSYADYIQSRWDTFGQMMSPYANYKPWMVTEGNHEKESLPLLVESFLAYNTRWEMPYKESGSNSNLYYSFEVAGVHVLMLGSYTDFDTESEQYKWLQVDLAKVNRAKTPWLIAMLHAPWYNSNTAHQGEDESEDMMAAMETLLYQNNVDLLFAGHVHAYERNLRVYKKKLDECGIVHITIGDGGNREGLATDWKSTQPAWSAKRESSFGFGQLNVVNGTHALWSWHRNQDVEAVMADEVWMTNLNAKPECARKA